MSSTENGTSGEFWPPSSHKYNFFLPGAFNLTGGFKDDALGSNLDCRRCLGGHHREQAFDKPLSADDKISHALSRLTFGPRPGDAEKVQQWGLDKWLDLQLHPDRISENPELLTRLDELPTLTMSSREAAESINRAFRSRENRQRRRRGEEESGRPNGPQAVVRELTEAKLLRAIYSERQPRRTTRRLLVQPLQCQYRQGRGSHADDVV
ncbi:MAG: DUF1800 family protein [Acidobacteriota bacterium]